MGKSKIETISRDTNSVATGPGKKLNHSSILGKIENHAIVFFEKNNSISTTKSDHNLVQLESNRGWWKL